MFYINFLLPVLIAEELCGVREENDEETVARANKKFSHYPSI